VLNRFVETGLAAGPIVLVGAIAVLILLRGGTAAQVGRRDPLHVDHIVTAHQGERRLVGGVLALPADGLLLLSALGRRLRTALAAVLATRDVPLGLLQCLVGIAGVARVLHDGASGGDEEDLQPNVDARLTSGERQWFYRHLGTREGDLPAVRLFADRDGLRRALDRTRPPDGNAPDRAEHQIAVLEAGAVSQLPVR